MPPQAWKMLRDGLRLALAAIFIYAGVLKIAEPQAFADSILSFQLLPNVLVDPLALGLPILEILIGGWLVTGCRKRQAAFCTTVLAGTFLIALGQAAVRGIAVDCGCFGSGNDPILSGNHIGMAILRDIALLLVALFLYFSALFRETTT